RPTPSGTAIVRGHYYSWVMMEDSEMSASRPDRCRRPRCPQGTEPPISHHLREMRAFLAILSREQRRLYAAIEANRIGRGGVSSVAAIMGLCTETIRRGQRDLAELVAEGRLPRREREVVGGRPRTEDKHPAITAALEVMLSDEVAGSPEGVQ